MNSLTPFTWADYPKGVRYIRYSVGIWILRIALRKKGVIEYAKGFVHHHVKEYDSPGGEVHSFSVLTVLRADTPRTAEVQIALTHRGQILTRRPDRVSQSK